MKTIICAALALLLTACGGNDYAKYLDAQAEFARTNPPRPLIVLEAHEGQQISGLKRLEVNAPAGVGQGGASIAPPPRNEWVGLASQALGIVGTVGGVVAGGRAAEGLARAVGEAATAGYAHIQAPAANVTTTTTTLSGTGVLGAGSYSAPVTTTTLSGTGAIGGNYTPTTTTTTDNHSVNSSYNPVTTYPVATPVTK